MVFSRDKDIEHEQKIFSVIRESLLQDPRIAQIRGNHHEDGSLDKLDGIVHKESYHAAGGIVPELSIKLGERQVAVQGEGTARDNPSIAVDALMLDQNPQRVSQQGEDISSGSPSIAPEAPSDDPNPRQSILKSEEISNDRPSAAKRLFRTGACGFMITVIVGSAFVWRSSDDKTKEMVRGWVNSLVSSSSFLPNNLPAKSGVAAEAASATSDQRRAEASVILPTASVGQPTPKSTVGESSADQQQQLETIVNDLAVIRRVVEQLAARQDQMARDIATLQAAEQDVSQKMSAPPSISSHPPPVGQK